MILRPGPLLLVSLLVAMTGSSAPCRAGAGKGVSLPLSEVELADEPRERERGLMHRRELCEDCGMLFAFPEERILAFWMKDTLLPLDMVFLDDRGRIVALHERTVPLRMSPPYASPVPARYVLEVNAGYASAHGLAPGRAVDLGSLFRKTVDYRWAPP